MESFLEKKVWWAYLEEDLQELLKESLLLSEKVGEWEIKFHDYSFIVFPAAKAYEGFLKKLFVDLGFITQNDYFSKHFRIGKCLNPALPNHLKDDGWVYEKLTKFCNGTTLADKLWDTWKRGRNGTFHWFPNEKTVISEDESRILIHLIIETIEQAFKECKVNKA